jgi:hypothetical protein
MQFNCQAWSVLQQEQAASTSGTGQASGAKNVHRTRPSVRNKEKEGEVTRSLHKMMYG